MPSPAVRRLRAAGITTGLLLAVVVPAPAWTQQAPAVVLTLHGTRVDAQVALLGDRGLPRILEEALGQDVDYYTEYLDVARFPNHDYERAVRDFLRTKYAHHRFDLVIAMDDVALGFSVTYRQDLFPDTPLVFASADPAGSRPPNSVGLVVPVNYRSTLTLAARLQPGLRQVVVVTGADRRDAAAELAARAQFQHFERQFRFTYLTGLPTEELARRLSALPSDAIVYYVLVNRDGGGLSFHPLEYLDRVVAASSVPVYCWVDSAMGRGIVGGTLKSQEKQVEAVGGLAVRVLQGEPADSIATITPDLGVTQVDWRELSRWNISEARLPPGTQVMFHQPSVWDRYRIYIVGAAVLMVLQSGLIAALLLQRRQRQRAEKRVQGSQAEIGRSHERIRDLAGRLIRAQDTERARIAKELHDDIGQQMALLSGDLELLSGLSEGQSSDLADEALRRVQGVTRNLQGLSHRLHPARLQLLGLVPSLEALVREVSKRGLPVTFSHEGVGALPGGDLTLSLFRIVQEALHNAAKHSRANRVRVDLVGDANQLTLTITDDGVGFDVGQAIGPGLGLVSIRERAEAVGGALDIRSGPTGSRLSVVVPRVRV